VIALVNNAVTRVVKPQPLPALDLAAWFRKLPYAGMPGLLGPKTEIEEGWLT
jgi:hypothetical protein